MAASFSAFFAVLCLKLSFVTVLIEGIQSLIHFKNHVSAPSAVSAVRAAIGYIQLPSEADMSVSALTGAD